MTSSFRPEHGTAKVAGSGFEPDPMFASINGFEATDELERGREPSIEEQLQTAFEQGRETGRADLPWREAEGLESATRGLEAAIAGLIERTDEVTCAGRAAVIELGLAIARQLVGHALEVDLDALSARVSAALEVVAGQTPLVLELAPDDHAVVLEGGAAAITRITEQRGVRIEPNQEIAPGQARIRGGESHVELDLDQALARIRQELLTLTGTRDASEEPA